ncbi:MAG: hypothetical protein SCARUB_04630 [Candidatus Scalindua rubra]|uniref:Uncharacterized protein n=1 Tax=Candidatus Scalindua rubra TaxID=1872076 RepID=A0A1E3X3R2_9BACT|nr:MAG: hypothetical protein SCARUB_04630 [Candidatus Scalindua rubra]
MILGKIMMRIFNKYFRMDSPSSGEFIRLGAQDIKEFTTEYYSNGTPKIIIGYENNNPNGKILFERHYTLDGLLENIAIHPISYFEEFSYLGDREYWKYIPDKSIFEYETPETKQKTSWIYFNGEQKAKTSGEPNRHIRLNSFGIESVNLNKMEYDILCELKNIPYPIEDAKEISIKYLDSDFRDSNNMLFIKYSFAGHQISLNDFVIPTILSKNDTNNSKLEKGANLEFPLNWRFSVSKSDSLWIDPDSEYWKDIPVWWEIAFAHNSENQNTIIWQNNGSPWSQGYYLHIDENRKIVYKCYWKLQWYSF